MLIFSRPQTSSQGPHEDIRDRPKRVCRFDVAFCLLQLSPPPLLRLIFDTFAMTSAEARFGPASSREPDFLTGIDEPMGAPRRITHSGPRLRSPRFQARPVLRIKRRPNRTSSQTPPLAIRSTTTPAMTMVKTGCAVAMPANQ